MSSLHPDPDLDLPRSPAPPPAVSAPEALAQPSEADATPYVLSGRRVRASVSGVAGVGRIEADGIVATGPWSLEGAAPDHRVRSPRRLRRRLTTPTGAVFETVIVPDGLPGLLVQYEWSDGPDEGAELRLEMEPLPDATGPRVRAEDGVVRVAAEGATLDLLLLGDAAAEWGVEGRSLRATFRVARGTPVTVAVGLSAADGPGLSLPALAAAPAHVRRAELDAAGDDLGGLRLRTGAPEIDDGLQWIRARLRDRRRCAPGDGVDQLHPAPGGRPTRGDLIVRAALASGDWAVGRAALLSLPPSPEALVAWARWMGWTGEAAFVLENRHRIAEAIPTLRKVGPFTAERVRKVLADAVEAAGEEAWANVLRAAASVEAPRVAEPAPPKRMTLPMAGGAPDEPAEAPLRPTADPEDVRAAARLGLPVPPGAPSRSRAAGDTSVDALLDGLEAYVLDDPATGWPPLMAGLAEWAAAAPDEESAGAAAVVALAEGMLGVRPDAAFGRIRLAPALPESWSRASFEGIRVEKIRLGMHWEFSVPPRPEAQRVERHSFLFVPEAGSVPGMLIFEPRLPGTEVDEVRIDGQVAEVATARSGDRVTIQVQLPADGERRIEIDVKGYSSEAV